MHQNAINRKENMYTLFSAHSITARQDEHRPQGATSSQEASVMAGSESDDKWEQQNRQKRKQREQTKKEGNKKTKQVIQGSAADTNFKAGSGPNRDLWIYNVDKEMKDDELRKFIEDGGSDNGEKVHIRLWEPRYEEHWDTKRFRLTIGLADYTRVFTADFWPKGILVRKYWVNLDKERKERKERQKQDEVPSEES